MSLGTLNAGTSNFADILITQSSELSFAGKGLKLDSDQDAQEIIEAIKLTKDLNSLELKGNTLGVNAAKAIGSALERHSNFKRALWSDLFTGRLKTEIPDALKFLCGGLMTAKACLVELDLSDNAFGPNGMIGLTDFLKSSSCYTLRELRLNNNGLGITGGKMLAESLLACHAASVAAGTPLALEIFVSGRGRLEDEGATALSQAFKAMKSLVEVHMPQNGINARGITALAEAFALNTKLKHINLSDNTFTEKGSTSMAKALPSLTALEVINFDDCLVRTAGAQAIAKSLAYNNHLLKILKLSGNEITKEGAEAVVGSVTNKSQLEELDLNANQLGESGKENIKRLMKAANKLKLLQSLSDDEGSDEDEAAESDDNEEEDKSEEEREEEEGVGDNESGEEYVQDGLEVIGQGLKSLSMPTVSIELQEFLSSPSAANLQRLGPKKTDDMLNYLGDKVKESDVVIPLLMKISGVVSNADQQTKVIACDLADAMLSRTFSDGTVSVICNAILVHLGLIKSEDKKFHPSDNIDGALIVLQHIVRQEYFPCNAKETLIFFIEQSLSNHNESSALRQQLLLALRAH